ncbi:MAG: IS21-like element IS21 family helper ATPase IstB [Rectinema sp.]
MAKPKMSVDTMQQELASFGLKQASKDLPLPLVNAETKQVTYGQFLRNLIDDEINARNKKRHHRNMTAAHFPPNPKPLEAFDPHELESGISRSQIESLQELNWIAAGQNLFFMGPPGLGKTMLAVGLGLKAIDAGYSVCYERMVSLIDILDNAPFQKIPRYRLEKLKKSQVVIIDEIGYTPITRDEANKFFTLISDLYERTSLIFTTNKRIDEWTEVMGDPVLTAALLDRILENATCFSLRGSSYRLKDTTIKEEKKPVRESKTAYQEL